MTYTEIIKESRSSILSAMEKADKDAYTHPALQFSVYVWTNGEITTLQDTAGGNWTYDHDCNCFKIATFCRQVWEWTDDDSPENNLKCLVQLASACHLSELSTFEAWREGMEENGKKLKFWECVKWWKESGTKTWEETREGIISDIVAETDYAEILDNVLEELEGE